MKKIWGSLPFRLLLGVVLGIVLGQFAGTAVMNVVVTAKYIIGQLINFCVPLIIIGFIAPSITKMGSNASRMLGIAILCAYLSSIFAALLSMGAGYALIPHLSIVSAAEGLRELPEAVFQLDIPVITLSQLSRSIESRSDHKPLLSDLRESGSIEQDADIVMFLHREALYNDQESVNDAKCIVAKNRHGETGSINLYWDGQYTRFSSVEYGRE